MNHFNLSNYCNLLRLQLALLCSITAICILSSSTFAAIHQQSSDKEQSIQILVGETDLALFQVPQGKVVSVPVTIQYPNSDVEIGAISIRVSYDPTYLQPVGCANESEKESYTAFCNHKDEAGTILLNAIDLNGLDKDINLAVLEFHAIGSMGSKTNLAVEIKQITDLDGTELSYVGQDGIIEIMDANAIGCTGANTCTKYDIYLPILRQ